MNVSSYYVFLPLGLLGYILALLQTSSWEDFLLKIKIKSVTKRYTASSFKTTGWNSIYNMQWRTAICIRGYCYGFVIFFAFVMFW